MGILQLAWGAHLLDCHAQSHAEVCGTSSACYASHQQLAQYATMKAPPIGCELEVVSAWLGCTLKHLMEHLVKQQHIITFYYVASK